MKLTEDNIIYHGIGRNFSDELFVIDLKSIVYGEDIKGIVTSKDPETKDGTRAYYKEAGENPRWWKVGQRVDVIGVKGG